MQVSITRSEFQRGLGRIQSIVEKRNTMPILAHALLTARQKEGRLEIAATDLDVGIRGSHPAEVRKAGGITVSARKLFEIVRELPEEQIELAVKENAFLEIRCARSRFSLAGTAAEEFPTLAALSPGTMGRLPAAVLASMIERTMYAASTDETRYNLNGVYFELLDDGAKLRMVATDGHRLALADRPVGVEASGLASGVILPRKALAELKRLVDEEDADEIELGFEGNSALARKGEVTLVMRLVEGEFPNYRQVVPKSSRHRVVLASDALAQAVRRVSLLSVERSKAIRVELGAGRLRVSTTNPDLGEATEELDLDYQGDGLQIGFNARYLLDCLAAFHSKEVELALEDELSPVVLRPAEDTECIAVVMPMRL
ncbi:MAG TPA: DNA polymerase III subunit beta [Myxococcota bacterium]|nr:DNA polymerase III subunit beta [Myxococcota bacterium]